MPVDRFAAILDTLLAQGVLNPETSTLYLYNWGEPFLHPEFNDIAAEITRRGLRYGLSTNASRLPAGDAAWLNGLQEIQVSMCGFSQASYDRIHGFDFQHILANIKRLFALLSANGFTGTREILYHIYRFNAGELAACENFATKHQAVFNPYYAIIADWWQVRDWLEGNTRDSQKQAIHADLYMEHFDNRKELQDGYRSCKFLEDCFFVDEHGSALTCCILPRNHPDYAVGNLQTDSVSAIRERRNQRPVCRWCKHHLLKGYFSHNIVPLAYVFSTGQQALRQQALARRLLAACAPPRRLSADAYLPEKEAVYHIDHLQCAAGGCYISGWAFLPGIPPQDCRILLLLSGQEGRFLVDTLSVHRPDVTRSLSSRYHMPLSHAGFETQATLPGPGPYAVDLVISHQGNRYRCLPATGRVLAGKNK